jgi:hypothetical protein
LTGHPNFKVDRPFRRKAHIAGAELHDFIRQPELLQDGFRVAQQQVELCGDLIRRANTHQLDLLELVLTDQTLYVSASRAGFSAEAWCSSYERQGEGIQRQYLIRNEIRDRHLCGWD